MRWGGARELGGEKVKFGIWTHPESIPVTYTITSSIIMSEAAIYWRDPDWTTQVWGSRADWRSARVTSANQLLPLI